MIARVAIIGADSPATRVCSWANPIVGWRHRPAGSQRPDRRRCARPPWGRRGDRSRGMRSCRSPAPARSTGRPGFGGGCWFAGRIQRRQSCVDVDAASPKDHFPLRPGKRTDPSVIRIWCRLIRLSSLRRSTRRAPSRLDRFAREPALALSPLVRLGHARSALARPSSARRAGCSDTAAAACGSQSSSWTPV